MANLKSNMSMKEGDSCEEKDPSIPTVVLDHDDEPGPPTALSATKDNSDEISASSSSVLSSPGHPPQKVWAQHTPSDYASTSEEKDVYLDVSEVEAIMSKPDSKITVRDLRRILSIMMVILYKTDVEIANKRKMKSLWDRRPSDWPQSVPFKDPNNGVKLPNGRHGGKPIQKEMMLMYRFLKKKYQREVKILTTHPEELESSASFSEFKEDVKDEPYSPVTPKLEPVTSIPAREEGGDMNVGDGAESVDMAEDLAQGYIGETAEQNEPQVIAPEGIDVRVEYVPATAAQPPSPAHTSAGQLHQVLEALYQRLVEHFGQVQSMVNAYNPTAADAFEKMGQALERLLEHTRDDPQRFSLIFNDVGLKVESFLSKVQLLHIPYVTNPHFAKECVELMKEIENRTAAALNVPPQHQSIQVGMVMATTQPLAARACLQQALSMNGSAIDHALNLGPSDVMSVVSQRAADQQQQQRVASAEKEKHAITGAELAESLNAVQDTPLQMGELLDSLKFRGDLSAEQSNRDAAQQKEQEDAAQQKEQEEAAQQKEKEEAAPTTEEMMEDVLSLEDTYGSVWSPRSEVSDLQSPSTPQPPRYWSADPAVLSLHPQSPYGYMSEAMQGNNAQVVILPNLEEDTQGEAAQSSTPVVPTTVVSMETEDHEDDHFELSHQGTIEEVYCD